MSKVIHVYDRDTMLVRDKSYNTQAIRLDSIDCAEWNQLYGRDVMIIPSNQESCIA